LSVINVSYMITLTCWQEVKKMGLTEHAPTPDDEEAVELSCDDSLASPEMDKTKDQSDDLHGTHHDKELEDLMAVESTAQACIMHALRIVSWRTERAAL
jgi:hypothetical protein